MTSPASYVSGLILRDRQRDRDREIEVLFGLTRVMCASLVDQLWTGEQGNNTNIDARD